MNIISWYGMVTHRAPVRGTSAIDGDKGEDSDDDSDDDDTGRMTAMVGDEPDGDDSISGSGAGRRHPGHQGQVPAPAGTGLILQGWTDG